MPEYMKNSLKEAGPAVAQAAPPVAAPVRRRPAAAVSVVTIACNLESLFRAELENRWFGLCCAWLGLRVCASLGSVCVVVLCLARFDWLGLLGACVAFVVLLEGGPLNFERFAV